MGHQKATLTTGDVTIELSLFEESTDALDTPYEEVSVTATLILPNGHEYTCRKDLDGIESGLIDSISSLIKPQDDAYMLLNEACTDVIEEAEEDTGQTLQISPNEVLKDFRQSTAATA